MARRGPLTIIGWGRQESLFDLYATDASGEYRTCQYAHRHRADANGPGPDRGIKKTNAPFRRSDAVISTRWHVNAKLPGYLAQLALRTLPPLFGRNRTVLNDHRIHRDEERYDSGAPTATSLESSF